MNPIARTFLSIAVGIAVVAIVSAAPAHDARAQAPPAAVNASIARVDKDCRDEGGVPRHGRNLIRRLDLNRDGRPDWLLDFRQYDCKRGIVSVCGTGGCALEIFLSRGAAWHPAWDENVRQYRLVRLRGGLGLEFDLHGSACNRTGYMPCRKRYLVRGTRLVPIH